jgi:hypothetical protein
VAQKTQPTDGAARDDPHQASSMSSRRMLLVYIIVMVLIAGHLYDVATSSEHWPFSRYQMYSQMPEMKTLWRLRLYGVTENGEIPLRAEEHFAPFNMPQLNTALMRLPRYKRREKVAELLHNLAFLYESSRQQGLHDDPPIQSLRLYRLKWTLDEWARNVDSPDKKILLLEARMSSIARRDSKANGDSKARGESKPTLTSTNGVSSTMESPSANTLPTPAEADRVLR